MERRAERSAVSFCALVWHHRPVESNVIDHDLDAREAEADRAAAARDIPTARRLLRGIVDAAPDRVETWLKLAAMCRAAGDVPAALNAIGGALRVDPLHFIALLSKGKLLEAAGDPQEAARTYTRALAQAPEDETPPPGLRAMIDHATAVRDAYAQDVADTWDRAIAADPAVSDAERRHLGRFKSNALRDTRVWHSDPTHYHYPGLVEREFHDREDFPWLAALEAAAPEIRRECQALLDARTARAEPYIRYADDTPVRQWAALNNSMDWTAFHLLHGGQRIAENADRCPATMAALEHVDQPHIANRGPNAMFSLLRPNTRIPPHTGIANTRLVCHLPLIIPPNCWFRVGAERREWRIGEALVFDDTIEHEAANDSGEPRVVLIIDLWHPGLSGAERAAVVRIMEADEAEHGAPL